MKTNSGMRNRKRWIEEKMDRLYFIYSRAMACVQPIHLVFPVLTNGDVRNTISASWEVG